MVNIEEVTEEEIEQEEEEKRLEERFRKQSAEAEERQRQAQKKPAGAPSVSALLKAAGVKPPPPPQPAAAAAAAAGAPAAEDSKDEDAPPMVYPELVSSSLAPPEVYPIVARWVMDMCEVKKAAGNKSFKLCSFTGHNEDIKWAIRRYSEAINYLDYPTKYAKTPPKDADLTDMVTEQENVDFRCACYLNRAACNLKDNANDWAEKDCAKVLTHKPGSAKAMFRRGEALAAMARWDEAVAQLRAAAEAEPKDKKIRAALKSAREGSEALERKRKIWNKTDQQKRNDARHEEMKVVERLTAADLVGREEYGAKHWDEVFTDREVMRGRDTALCLALPETDAFALCAAAPAARDRHRSAVGAGEVRPADGPAVRPWCSPAAAIPGGGAVVLLHPPLTSVGRSSRDAERASADQHSAVTSHQQDRRVGRSAGNRGEGGGGASCAVRFSRR